MNRKIVIGIVAVAILAIAILGMWLNFCDKQSLKWEIQDENAYDGFSWLSNNTKEGETVLAWWDYADGIEKIGHREVVIREASREIKETISGMHEYPWSWIEYELWYPFESEDKVRDVANFFIAENSNESIRIARKYGADYVLVVYPHDIWKFGAIVIASGKKPSDYVTGGFTSNEKWLMEVENRTVIKKETVGIKMIYGDEVDGFEKVFDNTEDNVETSDFFFRAAIRIYKLKE